MAKIKFEDGTVVNFQGNPTTQDVEEVAQMLNLRKSTPAQSAPKVNTVQPKSPFGSFIGKDLLGTGTEQADTIPRSIFQSTLGSKGVAGLFQLPARGVAAYQNAGAAAQGNQQIQESIQNSSKTTQRLIDEASLLPRSDPRRAQLLKQASESIRASSASADLTRENSQMAANTVVTPKQILGTTLNAATTVGSAALPGATSLGGKVLEGAGIGYASDVAQNALENKDNVATPGLGTVVGAVIPFGSALIGALGKRISGFTSGAGKDVIQQAIDNPKAVGEAMKTYAQTPELKQELVEKARNAIMSFLGKRNDEYGASIEQMIAPAGLHETVAADSFAKNIQKFGGVIDGDGALTFGDTALTGKDITNLKEAWALIKNWKTKTPQGYDLFRQAIGNLMDDFKIAGNSRANVVLGSVKQDLTDHLKGAIPGYANNLYTYGARTEAARTLAKELSLGGNAKASTQLNQVLRIFQKSPHTKADLVKILGEDGANEFLNEVSGAILSEWLPPGKLGNYGRVLAEGGAASAGLLAGNPALVGGAAVTAAASSPRIVGSTARFAGRAQQSGAGTAVRRIGATTANKITLPSQ